MGRPSNEGRSGQQGRASASAGSRSRCGAARIRATVFARLCVRIFALAFVGTLAVSPAVPPCFAAPLPGHASSGQPGSSAEPAASAMPASPEQCRAGTLVTLVAHLDDDLLFVNPGISERLRDGWCIVTVHLIGGADSSRFDYVLARERAIRQAYARMAGVPNAWHESTAVVAGRPVHRMVLAAAPRVTLYELRLPGGEVRGGRVPLGLVWDEGATISTYPMAGDGSGATRYDRAALKATVGALLAPATLIYTLNPDTVAFLEHPDHIYAARVAREAASAAGLDKRVRYHLTYVTAGMPANVSPAATQAKRDQAASYFAFDGGDIGQIFGEYEWNGDWVARRYAFDAPGAEHRGGNGPGTALVNARTSRCLTAAAAPGTAGIGLAPCDGGPAQRWRWASLPGYPGNPHGAALVNAATAQCVAERAGRLVEARCDDGDLAQRFTPWDFGIVRTPRGHCLGERQGAIALSACGPLTTAYRWTSSALAPWTDPRTAGALYGDVTGDGRTSAVYVMRRGDGPGFDVWVARLAAGTRASRWYANAVPFEPDASFPSCRHDTLCFDATRFVLGDFEGNGRADLMAIAPTDDGGTAFWLFANTGGAFAAPRLWQRSARAASTARTQQYVAADFDGDGRTDLMAAERTDGGAAFDLWVLTSRGTAGNAPARWRANVALAPDTQFLAAHVDSSPRAGLVAAERTGSALWLSRLASTGRAFDPSLRAARLDALRAGFTRLASGRLGNTGAASPRGTAGMTRTDGLVALSLREPDPANPALIDVWTIAVGPAFGAPVHAGTIADVAWADALPALVDDASQTVLALFERADAPLDEYHFTGGAPILAGCPLRAGGRTLGACVRWGVLPGRYSEALRLDRLH
ncbi:FG-GAP-like repeat-containing protein [Trinickia caryophylli]|uniref:Repeat domain-containing protein n=1 Tax=Trinickia caryophylli TaxID=28094 RepID=A0A1X7CGG3_TRICW|nr:FG-GAP-like repeat-containing protein [Trinickia caryophylli]WQE12811.1 FG-GAP-like repeat-containing protein [Trinickia caryophylli]SME96108.1 Repeat domain-containing protein [Trinickia caryophylli]